MRISILTASGLFLLVGIPAWGSPAKLATRLPGRQADGSVLLPNQWSLRPAGRQVEMGDFPVNIALHPDGHYAAVLHAGYSAHEIRILDLEKGTVIAKRPLDEAFYGLAWAPDGKRLYVSGAGAETVHVLLFDNGRLGAPQDLRVRPEEEEGVPIGIAASPDGRAIFVTEGWGQRILKIDVRTGHQDWVKTLSPAVRGAQSDPEGKRILASDDPDAAFPYAILPDDRRGRIYVSLWAKAAVLVLDARSGREIARWAVGEHPNELVQARDGRLFVAEANRNTVSVIDTNTGRVKETLLASLDPSAPPGSMPNSLAMSPDERTLYVANATNNDVALFDVSHPGASVSLGFIPVGWFPTSVRVSRDGKTLLVANGKGVASAANPRGPFPGDTRPKNLQQYIGGLFRGTVSLIAVPSEEDRPQQLAEWTNQAVLASPRPEINRPAASFSPGNPVPEKIGGASPFKYVIYVVKENRTYDQLLGDLSPGNGDAKLCLFGENVTPNHHALAREFVLLDNFYVDGEVSADGHEWTMAAYATDFVEKTWPLNYGHGKRKKIDYPGEGRYPLSIPAGGYLWDQAAKAGVTYRSYGEFIRDAADGSGDSEPALPVLRDHFDPNFRTFDLTYPDVRRIDRFNGELKRYESEGEMPRLQVVRIGNDHTEGTKPGALTPTALVGDNDLALGRLVEAVSHSKFWRNTVIFVLEDDAQNGPDHVDAHRSPAFAISPYTRRHTVDSTMYSTSSILHTIELILGLQPMSQYDAAATPLYRAFQATVDLSPYDAKPARVDLTARNSATAWGARESQRMDFAEADRVDDLLLNEIVWRSVRGPNSPMPSPVRAAFLRVHPTKDGDE